MTKLYEVQENTLIDGWVNNWSYTDEVGSTEPTYFISQEVAEIELDYFLEDMLHEFRNGNMADVPNRSDFRIVEVNP